MGLVLNFIVDDGLTLDLAESNQSVNTVLIDEILDVVDVLMGNAVPYVNLCLDTEGLRPSIHSLPFFSSLCEVDGELYGTTPDGIHKLYGDTDDGQTIHTGLAWVKNSFGISNKKKFRAIVLEGDVDSVTVKAQTESGSALYPIKRNRVAMGRNLIGRDWDIRVVDFDRLDSFEIIPIIGRR